LFVVDARHSHLPDDAAGVFAPGWDISADATNVGHRITIDGKRFNRRPHLAAYGLGSPFPEDVKFCAALSTYRPAVAPDVSRAYAYAARSDAFAVCPLTDDEIGVRGWDASPGPRIIYSKGVPYVEYESFYHIDYVKKALTNQFRFGLIAGIDIEELTGRVSAMALTYFAVGAKSYKEKSNWVVFSFRPATSAEPELLHAQQQARSRLATVAFRVQIFRLTRRSPHSDARVERPPQKPRTQRIRMHDLKTLYVDVQSRHVLLRDPAGKWRSTNRLRVW